MPTELAVVEQKVTDSLAALAAGDLTRLKYILARELPKHPDPPENSQNRAAGQAWLSQLAKVRTGKGSVRASMPEFARLSKAHCKLALIRALAALDEGETRSVPVALAEVVRKVCYYLSEDLPQPESMIECAMILNADNQEEMGFLYCFAVALFMARNEHEQARAFFERIPDGDEYREVRSLAQQMLEWLVVSRE